MIDWKSVFGVFDEVVRLRDLRSRKSGKLSEVMQRLLDTKRDVASLKGGIAEVDEKLELARANLVRLLKGEA